MAKLQRQYSQENFEIKLNFPHDSEVEFKILKSSETHRGDALLVKTEVLSGENKGRHHSFYMGYEFKNGDENFNTTNFLKVFFSMDDLINGDADLDKLVDQLFSAKSQISKCGKYLNWGNFKELGADLWKAPGNKNDSDNADSIPF